ncbi:oligosaccharide flippase family protein [Aliifodinibius sp. S!AR15-10]|uniref:lipopolysaccharide biosynthesis protein n=1 Tax=Aliifodinibius sp. S!AR15-10 TaxID=2950437 RepID=UPI0028616241|nr:oligosaccharide flippase family protein [Aliifodinibius sp. S!AR15-10]MDR8394598.1 oligosaccharide flippase family protein [Aliifodinibius sp. S!AR15-10]
MGVIVRQSIQNTVIAYIGITLGFISVILLYPRALTADQYGLTRILVSLTAVSSQFAHLGMKNTITRFLPHFRDTKADKYGLLFLTLVIPLGGFLLFTILFFLFDEQLIYYYSDQSELIEQYYLYLLPLVGVVVYFEVLNSYVRALKDSVTGSFLNEVLMRLFIIMLLLLYWYDLFSFSTFMVFFVLIYATEPFILLFYLYRKNELYLKIPFRDSSRRLIPNLVSFGAYTMLGGLTTILVGNIDIIMIGAMTNLANTGVYAVAFYVGSVIEIPKRSIAKIATPIIADLMKERDFKKIEDLYARTSLNQLIGGSLLLIGIWANMHNLVALLPPEYQGVKWIIITIGFAKLVDMTAGMNGQIILNSRHYRFDLYTMILLVILTAATNYLLIPIYGILGAAIATAISIFVYNLVKYIFVWIKFSMQPLQWNALGVVAIAVGCLLLSFQIPYMLNFVVDVTVRSLLITVVFIGAILLFDLSNDVKNLTKESIRRVRVFFGW